MKQDNYNPFDLFSSNKSDLVRTFSEELLSLRGKILELYIGDEAESLNYDEGSTRQNSSIFGELIDVLDRFIIMDCLYIDNDGNIKRGNKIYINTFQIRAMTVLDGHGSLRHISLNVRDAAKIRDMFRQPKIK